VQREAFDPLLLGQRLVALLETGLRTATYKLATLMALLEHCIENLPQRADDTLRVPLQELAHRVLEIYWRQVRPFDGHELRQSTQSPARILIATNQLRAAAGRATVSVDVARWRATAAYQTAIDEITLCLAQQPCTTMCRGQPCVRTATRSNSIPASPTGSLDWRGSSSLRWRSCGSRMSAG